MSAVNAPCRFMVRSTRRPCLTAAVAGLRPGAEPRCTYCHDTDEPEASTVALKPKDSTVSRRRGSVAAKPTQLRLKRIREREEAILDAGLGLFSRFGLHGTSLDQIAEAAEVSRTNIFYYFSSKEVVYQAVMQRLLKDWLAPLETLDLDSDPIEALHS